MSELVKIGALWKNTDKDGNEYFSGTMGDATLLVFKNNHKSEDKHPDYIVYVTQKKKKNDIPF